WFAGLLRDGFALTVAGGSATFVDLAAQGLQRSFSKVQLNCSIAQAVAQVMEGFADLSLHADVASGLRRLRAGGVRIVTLSNGPSTVAEKLLVQAGVAGEVERFLSVEGVSPWKPAAAAYECALTTCGVDAADAMLVAVHPWDIDGAMRAGLQTAWIDRNDGMYPDYFSPWTLRATSVEDLADQLAPAS
ncbi:MAG: haloacid dehalogenase type II, partial [Kineosporiaceae bacterium]|nr:haloacid dehalogenase type II [Aeromicrobium sp.]